MKIVVIIGVGGIGSSLFQKLSRYTPLDWNICLVDGDTVEDKNLYRQMFTRGDIGKNKAEVLSHKANNQLSQRYSYYPHYLNTTPGGIEAPELAVKQLDTLTKNYEHIVIMGCVDNHSCRRSIEHYVKNFNCELSFKYDNRVKEREVVYIDGANEEHTGDVVSVFRNSKGIKGAFRSQYDYSVNTDTKNDPNTSCQSDLLDGNIQTMIANDKVAITMVEVFNSYLESRRCTGLWKFKATKPKNRKLKL